MSTKKPRSLKDAIAQEIAKDPTPPPTAIPQQNQQIDLEDMPFTPSYSDVATDAFSASRRDGMRPGVMPGIGMMPRGITGNRALDELLTNIPKNDGWYLKLYKEIAPTEFQLKERLTQWEGWADLEWEIMYIVREKTKANPKLWGSGRYRIVPFREGGLRGSKKFEPHDFLIDAGEPEEVRGHSDTTNAQYIAAENFKAQLETFKDMAELFKTGQADPNRIPILMAESMQKGIDLSAAKENANATVKSAEIGANSNSMGQLLTMMGNMMVAQQNKPVDSGSKEVMSLMIQNMNELMKMQLTKPQDTGMQAQMQMLQTVMVELMKAQTNKPVDDSMQKTILLIKEMGLLEKPKKEDPIDLLIKLKQAGLIPDNNQKKEEDSVAMVSNFIEKMRPVAEIITGGGGATEKPSAFIEIAKAAVGPVSKVLGEGFNLWRSHQELEKIKILQRNVPPTSANVGQVEEQQQYIPQQSAPPPQRPSEPRRGMVVTRNDGQQEMVDYDSIGNGPGNRDMGVDPSMLHAPSVGYDPNMEVPMRPPEEQQIQPEIRSRAEFRGPVEPRNSVPPLYQANGDHGSIPVNAKEVGGSEMFPEVKALKQAIGMNDPKFFPQLKEMLLRLSGEDDFDKLISGETSIQSVVSQPQVQFFTGPWIVDPRSINYFEQFIKWVKDREVHAVCPQGCGDLYYESKDHLEQDSLCPVCATPMQESSIKG